MTTPTTPTIPPVEQSSIDKKAQDTRSRIIGGAALILIGLLVLAAQLSESTQLMLFIPAGLGIIFLAWGLIDRNFYLLIPGGILLGIGAGIYLMASNPLGLAEEAGAGAFMIVFGAGWLLVSLLSPLTREGFQWWPIIPGVIIGLVGVALLAGGVAMDILQIAGYAWPLILVGIGVYLLLRRRG